MLNLIDTRNRHFIARCREIITSSPRPLTLDEVAAKAIRSAAPAYYAGYDIARRIVTELRLGHYSGTNPRRRSMWEEFDRKVAAREKRGQRIDRAVATVLSDAVASSFFISHARAVDIIRLHLPDELKAKLRK